MMAARGQYSIVISAVSVHGHNSVSTGSHHGNSRALVQCLRHYITLVLGFLGFLLFQRFLAVLVHGHMYTKPKKPT